MNDERAPIRYDACIPKGLMHVFLKLCCTHSQRYVACTHKGIKNILLKLLCTHSQKYDTHCYMCDACTIFSWKCPIFFGDWWFFMWLLVIFWLGLGNPRHIATSKSPFYMVVVLVWKSWDWVRTLPPLVGTKSQLWTIFFNASLNNFIRNGYL